MLKAGTGVMATLIAAAVQKFQHNQALKEMVVGNDRFSPYVPRDSQAKRRRIERRVA